jgi:hypothetical protein
MTIKDNGKEFYFERLANGLLRTYDRISPLGILHLKKLTASGKVTFVATILATKVYSTNSTYYNNK